MSKYYKICRLGNCIIHINDKPHRCKYCGKRFIRLNALETHLSSHDESKGYCRNISKKQFAKEHNYSQHIGFHSDARRIKSQSTKENAKLYANIQQNVYACEKPHTCRECNKSFLFEKNLKIHMCSAHNLPGSTEMNHVCSVCNQSFENKSIYDEHVLEHCEETPTDNSLPTETITKPLAKIQPSVVTSETSHSCIKCDKKFCLEKDLKCHILSAHETPDSIEEIHLCFVCNTTYKDKDVYDAHVFSHSGPKLYLSECCRQPFFSISELNKHICLATPDSMVRWRKND